MPCGFTKYLLKSWIQLPNKKTDLKMIKMPNRIFLLESAFEKIFLKIDSTMVGFLDFCQKIRGRLLFRVLVEFTSPSLNKWTLVFNYFSPCFMRTVSCYNVSLVWFVCSSNMIINIQLHRARIGTFTLKLHVKLKCNSPISGKNNSEEMNFAFITFFWKTVCF